MAWSFPAPTGTPTTWLTNLVASLQGILDSFPGSQLRAASVARDRLAKQGAEAPICVNLGLLAAASYASLASVGLPVADGAAVTRRFTYASVCVSTRTARVKVAGSSIKVWSGATFAGKALQLTIDLNAAGFVADEPYLVTAGFSVASGNNLYFTYVSGGAANYDDVNVTLYYESPHVDPTT